MKNILVFSGLIAGCSMDGEYVTRLRQVARDNRVVRIETDVSVDCH